jgi:hypothetical protein
MDTAATLRWIRERRSLVAAVVAIAMVLALVPTLMGRSGPPVIRIAGSGAQDGAAMAESDAPEMTRWMPANFTFELADSARFGAGQAPAWRLEPPRDLEAAAAALATKLGLGEPIASPYGDNGFQVGPMDGSGPTLWVGSAGDWSYHDPAGFADRGCVAPDYSGDPAEPSDAEIDEATRGEGVSGEAQGSGPDAESDPDSMPVERLPEPCVEQEPPTGVPTVDEARRDAAAFLANLDPPFAPEVVDAYGDEWSVWVNATVSLDGRPTDLYFGVAYGGDRLLSSASGTLARPVKVADYPTVDAEGAVERLNTQHAWGGSPGMTTTRGPADDIGITEPAIDPPAPDEAGVDPDTPVDDGGVPDERVDDDTTMPFPGPTDEADEVLVHLVSAEQVLTIAVDAEHTVWLLPAVRFTDENGGVWQTLTVADGYIEFVDHDDRPVPLPGGEPEPMPVDPPLVDPDQPGADPGPGPMERYEELAAEVIGMSEAEAIDHIEAAGATVRVVSRDGEHFAVTDDARWDRVNLQIEDGRVIDAKVG